MSTSILIRDPITKNLYSLPTSSALLFKNPRDFFNVKDSVLSPLPSDAVSVCGEFFNHRHPRHSWGPPTARCAFGYPNADFELSSSKVAIGNKFILSLDDDKEQWKSAHPFARALACYFEQNEDRRSHYPSVKSIRESAVSNPRLKLLSAGGFVFVKSRDASETGLALCERNEHPVKRPWQAQDGLLAHRESGAEEIAEELTFALQTDEGKWQIGVPCTPRYSQGKAESLKKAQLGKLKSELQKIGAPETDEIIALPLFDIDCKDLGVPTGTLRVVSGAEILKISEGVFIGNEISNGTVTFRRAYGLDLSSFAKAHIIDGEFARKMKRFTHDELRQAFENDPEWGLTALGAFASALARFPKIGPTADRSALATLGSGSGAVSSLTS